MPSVTGFPMISHFPMFSFPFLSFLFFFFGETYVFLSISYENGPYGLFVADMRALIGTGYSINYTEVKCELFEEREVENPLLFTINTPTGDQNHTQQKFQT